MRQVKFVASLFLLSCFQQLRAQDQSCADMNVSTIQAEIRSLVARLDTLIELKGIIEGKFSIVYKEVQTQVQHLPDTNWRSSICVQKYMVEENRDIDQIKQHIGSAFRSTRQSINFYGEYLKIHFGEWLINSPETIRKSYLFIYKKD